MRSNDGEGEDVNKKEESKTMSNFIFISPNFPTNYWQFCRELKNDGMNVLGIGDQPYDELKPELKDSLNEYYKVGSLENYDEVYRAVAFFAFKYGRIDWLESNNEYWLERDAALTFSVSSLFVCVRPVPLISNVLSPVTVMSSVLSMP